MPSKSYRQIAVGISLALLVPVLFWALTVLIDNGVVSFARPIDWAPLTIIALSEIVLGPLGVVVAGRGAGVRGVIAWLVLLVVTMPVLFVIWLDYAMGLSGALGAPF
jgi:hypothetical protein